MFVAYKYSESNVPITPTFCLSNIQSSFFKWCGFLNDIPIIPIKWSSKLYKPTMQDALVPHWFVKNSNPYVSSSFSISETHNSLSLYTLESTLGNKDTGIFWNVFWIFGVSGVHFS